MSDNTNPNNSSNNKDGNDPEGGRPAKAEEQEKLTEILNMLRQQNLNVTSIPLNQNGGGAVSRTSGNVIADNAGGFVDDGKKKHAFWDTQVRFVFVFVSCCSAAFHCFLLVLG